MSEALQSVLNQNYKHWECIIVNDGSTDDTETVAAKFLTVDSRFKYINKLNGGLSSARNEGIRNAAGEFILPLDADDIIGKEYAKLAVGLLIKCEDVKLVYCNAEKFGAEKGKWQLPDFDYEALLKGNMIFCSAVFRKKDCIAADMYDESMKIGLEDWEFWIRLLNENSKVIKLDGSLFFYRIKNQSMNTTLSKSADDIKYYIYLKHVDIYRRFFKSPIALAEENAKLKSMYKDSLDYKLGNKMINPFRRILSLFKTSK